MKISKILIFLTFFVANSNLISSVNIKQPYLTLVNNSEIPQVCFEIETKTGDCEIKNVIVNRGRVENVDFKNCKTPQTIVRVIARQVKNGQCDPKSCVFITNYQFASSIHGCSDSQPNTKGIENQFSGEEARLIVTLSPGLKSKLATASEQSNPQLFTSKP